jgi:hypothetical protein
MDASTLDAPGSLDAASSIDASPCPGSGCGLAEARRRGLSDLRARPPGRRAPRALAWRRGSRRSRGSRGRGRCRPRGPRDPPTRAARRVQAAPPRRRWKHRDARRRRDQSAHRTQRPRAPRPRGAVPRARAHRVSRVGGTHGRALHHTVPRPRHRCSG